MSVIQFNTHLYEQMAYAEIRNALSKSFIESPNEFVEHFGCRPEDLSGSTLRDYYAHMLVQQVPIEHSNPTFVKKFVNGEIF